MCLGAPWTPKSQCSWPPWVPLRTESRVPPEGEPDHWDLDAYEQQKVVDFGLLNVDLDLGVAVRRSINIRTLVSIMFMNDIPDDPNGVTLFVA